MGCVAQTRVFWEKHTHPLLLPRQSCPFIHYIVSFRKPLVTNHQNPMSHWPSREYLRALLTPRCRDGKASTLDSTGVLCNQLPGTARAERLHLGDSNGRDLWSGCRQLEVSDEGVCRAMLSPDARGDGTSLLPAWRLAASAILACPWLARSSFQSLPVGLASFPVSVCLLFL